MRVLINTFSGAGVRIAMMVVGFALTPYIIHRLGLPYFGLWSVIGAMAGYLGVLDFGLSGAFVKFLTQAVETGKLLEARRVFTLGVLFYLGFAALLVGLTYAVSPLLIGLLRMPASEGTLAVAVFRAIFAILMINLVLGLPGMFLVALHRMDMMSRNLLFGYAAYAIATVTFLHAGYQLWALVIAQAVQVVVTCVLQYVSVRRLHGPLWANPFLLDGTMVRAIFSFGGWTQVNTILTIINVDVGRFVAASLVSVVSVSYYELGSKVAYISKMLPEYFIAATLPAAAAADARRDAETLSRIYASGSVYLVFATMCIGGFLMGAGGPLIRVWIGASYPYVPAIIVLLGIGYAFNSMVGVGTTILRARGLPQYETQYTAVGTVVNLGCTLLLAPRLGIVGVALGTGLGWVAAALFFLVVFHRVAKVAWWHTVGERNMKLFAATAVMTIALGAVLRLPHVAALFSSKFVGLAVLAASGIVYIAGLLALTAALRVWSNHDLARVGRVLQSLRMHRPRAVGDELGAAHP